MTNRDMRELALLLLDDQEGINGAAYDKLASFLSDAGCEDILQQVDGANGRYYIGEDFAEEALRDISKWEEAQNVEKEENA